nr:unnamed protein product [Callosobruchus analis]
MLLTMKNLFIKIYLEFMSYTLGLMTKLISNFKQSFKFEDDIYKYLNIVDPLRAQTSRLRVKFWMMNGGNILFWILTNIFKLKNAANVELFPNLKKVINLLLVLPFSKCLELKGYSVIYLILKLIKEVLFSPTLYEEFDFKRRN